MHGKKLDIVVLILLALCEVVYATVTKDFFAGKAVIAGSVYIIPSIIYLGIRKKKNWAKVFTATLVFGGIFGFFFEFIAEFNRAYSVLSVLFPRVFNVLPLDNVIGHMMMTMLTIVFYEHFVDREINHHVSKHLKYSIFPGIFAIAAALIMYILNPSLLTTRYPYLYMGLAAIIPPIYLGITKPKFIRNMAITAIYFFFFYFIIEIIAVRQYWWIYPGNNYIGWVKFLEIEFPFEELFFWMLFYAASLVSYYELFIDDHNTVKEES